MQINTQEIDFLVGNIEILNNMSRIAAMPMFSDRAIEFLAALSSELMHDSQTREYVDVLSYAYWIRRASIEKSKVKYADHDSRIGRGVAFHIAPSNVPVNFAVSMTSALLAGNASIIRLSNKSFDQVNIICDAINKLLACEFGDLQGYFCFIRYNHDDEITQCLSDLCDVRIIWGGNDTIKSIRRCSLPSRSIELAFADRYSVAVINSDNIDDSEIPELVKGFYTDTYYSDQNACSSPRMVIWIGNNEYIKDRFWNEFNGLVKRDYKMKPIQAVDKFNSFCECAMAGEDVKLVNNNNCLMRVKVDTLSDTVLNYKNGGGLFYEYNADSLEEMVPILGKMCQTISYAGIDKQEIKRIVFVNGVRGVDRIVPMGQTMGLEFIWDGYKMIEAMSRVVYVSEL